MAYTFMCDNECGEQAAITVQILGTPDVMAFCVPCSAQWAEAHAATIREAIAQHEAAQAAQVAETDAVIDAGAEPTADELRQLDVAAELAELDDEQAELAEFAAATDTDERG